MRAFLEFPYTGNYSLSIDDVNYSIRPPAEPGLTALDEIQEELEAAPEVLVRDLDIEEWGDGGEYIPEWEKQFMDDEEEDEELEEVDEVKKDEKEEGVQEVREPKRISKGERDEESEDDFETEDDGEDYDNRMGKPQSMERCQPRMTATTF